MTQVPDPPPEPAAGLDPVDRLLIDEMPPAPGRLLVLDAPELANALAAEHPVVGWCDSLLAEQRLRVPVVDPATATVDTVLMRTPKAVGALGEYAEWVARDDIALLAGGRVKYLTHSMNDALAARFGSVRASLGRQKSRVLHARQPRPGTPTWPRRATVDLPPALGGPLVLSAHGGTFAGTRIDPGTRVLVDLLDRLPAATPALDLGSGNGTLSALLARRGHPVTALDESWAATAATRETLAANGLTGTVRRADGLTGLPTGSVPLIVCNPPFHVGTAKDSGPAYAMIEQAARVLEPGGELWLVFNAHLPYLPTLRRRIGPTEIVSRHPKYLVTRSVRG
ncbi:class I SAM-dependent methyltransferase [Granulicoccus phenolivorans]|uniref:class I SAM-dependent methyltransferase n=1 Tax=Granulicoccus phenolivorans TaxID=266854 RepID=UPI00040AD277|nr:methyltransferase [Granulicoccus phenolivorans]